MWWMLSHCSHRDTDFSHPRSDTRLHKTFFITTIMLHYKISNIFLLVQWPRLSAASSPEVDVHDCARRVCSPHSVWRVSSLSRVVPDTYKNGREIYTYCLITTPGMIFMDCDTLKWLRSTNQCSDYDQWPCNFLDALLRRHAHCWCLSRY